MLPGAVATPLDIAAEVPLGRKPELAGVKVAVVWFMEAEVECVGVGEARTRVRVRVRVEVDVRVVVAEEREAEGMVVGCWARVRVVRARRRKESGERIVCFGCCYCSSVSVLINEWMPCDSRIAGRLMIVKLDAENERGWRDCR